MVFMMQVMDIEIAVRVQQISGIVVSIARDTVMDGMIHTTIVSKQVAAYRIQDNHKILEEVTI